jgi:hypothetical protein
MERRLKSLANIADHYCDWCSRPATTIEPTDLAYVIVCENADCLASALGSTAHLSSAIKEPKVMVDMSKYIASNFIKYEDVEGAPAKKTIVKVEPGKFDKPVLTFNDGKQLGLNKTNVRMLVRAFGKDDAGWLGNTVELYAGNVQFQNKSFDTVLINPSPKN